MSRSDCALRFSFLALALVLLAFPAGATAQLTTAWSGITSSDWSSAGNWSDGVPAADVDVLIDGGFAVPNSPALDADGVAGNIFISQGETTQLDIALPYTLDVTTDVQIDPLATMTGTINQSDGTLNVGRDLWIGTPSNYDNTGTAVYNMSGGELNISGRQIVVGSRGAGSFIQTGGTVNNPDAFYVGDNSVGHFYDPPNHPGGGGTMTVNGGVFNGGAYYGIIGTWGGNGTLNVGGTGILNTNALEMGLGHFGNEDGSTSAINLSGTGQINLGDYMTLAANAATTGTLTQTGGTLTVSTLIKGPGTGTYNLTGGTLNVSEILDLDFVNNGATVNVGGPGAVTTLTVAKYVPTENLALNKPSSMSSLYYPTDPPFPASFGNDGNYNNFCHSDNLENSWWRVDLTEGDTNMQIHDIVISSRADGFNEHFSNFYVRVIDKDDVTIWEQKYITDPSEFLAAGERLAIPLNDFYDARYIEVQIDGWNLFEQAGGGYQSGYLFFAELEVFSASPSLLGDFTQDASSTLGIELDPDNTLADKVVASTLTLDGTLDVTSLGGTFASGQVFDILDWETLVGTFDTVNLPTLGGSLSWDVSNLYVTGELAVAGGDPVPGDANGDGYVNQTDAEALAANWGSGEATWAMGDFNDDDVVDMKDASILAANWGTTPTAESVVPEPGMLALLLGSVVGLVMFGRRTKR